MADDPQDSGDKLKFVKRLYDLQTERVETYKLFEEGFVAYLKGAPHYNFQMYKQLVNEVTTTFNNISKEIIQIGNDLHAVQRTDLSTLIQEVQQLEQVKLASTAELQMARQEEVDSKDIDLSDKVNDHRIRIAKLIGEINEKMDELKYSAEDLYNS